LAHQRIPPAALRPPFVNELANIQLAIETWAAHNPPPLSEKPPTQIQGEHMKRILLLLAALALSTVAAGTLKAQAMTQASPFLGTWKLNVEKSKVTGIPLPKSLTRVVAAQDGGTKFSYKGIAADGSPIDYSFVTNYDGKDSAVTGSGAPAGTDAIAIKRISAYKAEAILKKGGKEIGKTTAEVSKDGKVTTLTGSGKTPDGKDYKAVTVYDKQ